MTGYDIVVPTLGRPSLAALLASLRDAGATPARLVVVDDRPAGAATQPLDVVPPCAATEVTVVRTGGRGPAAARNAGADRARSPWLVFLDDDVVVAPDWADALTADLDGAGAAVAVQGCIEVPLPPHRRPTDWERNVAGLATAPWITADMAVRREAFRAVGGFDEGFPRAYREDSDLAVRLRALAGDGALRVGGRRTVHPVRPADRWVSLRAQRGNADDARLAARHGRRWRALVGAEPSALSRYAGITALGAVAALAAGARCRRSALAAGGGWAVATGRFAARRIAPGPRTADEVVTMVVTSALIPPLALGHRAWGWWRHRAVRRGRAAAPRIDRAVSSP